MISDKLKVWKDTLDTCIEEMKESFMIAVKKAIVDFVLKDPSTKEAIVSSYTSDQKEMMEMSKNQNWKQIIATNSKKMKKNLHLINPCIAQLLDLWYTSYR